MTASIAGLITLGITVVQLFQTIEDIRSAPESLQALTRELEGLCGLLQTLEGRFRTEAHQPLWNYLERVLRNCKVAFLRIQEVIKLHKAETADSRITRKIKGYKWLRRTDEIANLKSELDLYRSAFIFALTLDTKYVRYHQCQLDI